MYRTHFGQYLISCTVVTESVGITRQRSIVTLQVVSVFNICMYLQITLVSPETGDLRLVGGDAPYEGRLEIYIDGSWGTICSAYDEYYNYYNYEDENPFGLLEADAACRQLGYTRAAEVYFP